MKNIVNNIKDNFRKEMVLAPSNIYKILKLAQKDIFWLRINETLRIDNNLEIHTQSPIKCKEKDIRITFYENNKEYIVDKFELVDENTIKISQEYFNVLQIVDTEKPTSKVASVSFLTIDKFKNRELAVLDGELFIKASITKNNICIGTDESNNSVYQILINFNYYKLMYTNCDLTILKDSIDKTKYNLYIVDDEVKLKKVI